MALMVFKVDKEKKTREVILAVTKVDKEPHLLTQVVQEVQMVAMVEQKALKVVGLEEALLLQVVLDIQLVVL